MRHPFPLESFRQPLASSTFPFMKGCHAVTIPPRWEMPGKETTRPDLSTKLYDLNTDPTQSHPVENPAIETAMIEKLRRLMAECHAPPKQYLRLGIAP